MLISLILGTALIVLPIITLFVCLVKTPTNLRGFYGKMFATFVGISLIAGSTLITLSLLGILG